MLVRANRREKDLLSDLDAESMPLVWLNALGDGVPSPGF